MHICKTELNQANPSHSITQRVVSVYFLRNDIKLSIYDLT